MKKKILKIINTCYKLRNCLEDNYSNSKEYYESHNEQIIEEMANKVILKLVKQVKRELKENYVGLSVLGIHCCNFIYINGNFNIDLSEEILCKIDQLKFNYNLSIKSAKIKLDLGIYNIYYSKYEMFDKLRFEQLIKNLINKPDIYYIEVKYFLKRK